MWFNVWLLGVHENVYTTGVLVLLVTQLSCGWVFAQGTIQYSDRGHSMVIVLLYPPHVQICTERSSRGSGSCSN
jgi:hypothetical protein